MNSCAILGASGHGKVVAELAELNGYKDVTFFDDAWPKITHIEHWSVRGNSQLLLNIVSQYDVVIVAIGNNEIRLSKQQQLKTAGAKFTVLIHPSACVSAYAELGLGTVVMANAVVNPFSSTGEACIINTGSSVDHDCQLQEGVHISPGVNIAGGVSIGRASWLGIGSQVKQLISIGSYVTIGSGSNVVKDIDDHQIVVGNPARS